MGGRWQGLNKFPKGMVIGTGPVKGMRRPKGGSLEATIVSGKIGRRMIQQGVRLILCLDPTERVDFVGDFMFNS